ncbi:hypothetical protein VTN96DRAFT_8761 [Rasamsonia emersonii]
MDSSALPSSRPPVRPWSTGPARQENRSLDRWIDRWIWTEVATYHDHSPQSAARCGSASPSDLISNQSAPAQPQRRHLTLSQHLA